MTTAFTPTQADRNAVAPEPRPAGLGWTAVLFSTALLVVSVWFADSRQVLTRLEGVDSRWLVAAFAVSILQLTVLGLRYSKIATALGLKLRWLRATTEYALSVLVNQVLPSGIAGDGVRVIRHARSSSEHGLLKVLEAVALDRFSGQLALWLVVLVTAPFSAGAEVLDYSLLGFGALGLACLVLFTLAVASRVRRWVRFTQALKSFLLGAIKLLLAPKRALIHLPLSLLLIAFTLMQLYIASRAVGVFLSFKQLLWLGPLILLATSVPSFFGGWGIREGASAILFAAIGMPSSTGVAVSLVYGAFALIVALPGLTVLLFDAERAAPPRARWSHAHSLSMIVGSILALWSQFPALLAFVAAVSFSILVVQSRSNWTADGRFGLANSVTTLRLLLIFLLLFGHLALSGAWLAALAMAILLLDVVDGWLARRLGLQSDFGARYDVEVDTLLVLGLSMLLWGRGVAGAWVLAPALWRYLYVLSPLVFPTKNSEAPRSRLGRAGYIFMILMFLTALIVAPHWGERLAAAGTILMSVSFIRSFWQRYLPADAP